MLISACGKKPDGENAAAAFPAVEDAPAVHHTARQTSQLHKIPERKHCKKVILTFAAPVFTVRAPSISPPDENIPVLNMRKAMMILPIRLAMYTIAQLRIICVRVILLPARAMVIRLLPVNSSAPARVTRMSPPVKTVAANTLPSPYELSSRRRLNAAILDAAPAKAMYAPAIMPKVNKCIKDPFALPTPVSVKVSSISAGLR